MDHGGRLVPGGVPRRHADEGFLDALVPDRPVFLLNRDHHGGWANSRALERAGVTSRTPDPADGRIERTPKATRPACSRRAPCSWWPI